MALRDVTLLVAVVPARTFAEVVTDSFLSAYDGPDTVSSVNEPILGGNGRLPEDATSFELQSFYNGGMHDSGDEPDFGRLDWVTW